MTAPSWLAPSAPGMGCLLTSGVTISLRNSEADYIKVDLAASGN